MFKLYDMNGSATEESFYYEKIKDIIYLIAFLRIR